MAIAPSFALAIVLAACVPARSTPATPATQAPEAAAKGAATSSIVASDPDIVGAAAGGSGLRVALPTILQAAAIDPIDVDPTAGDPPAGAPTSGPADGTASSTPARGADAPAEGPTAAGSPAVDAGPCAGIARREGGQIVVGGRPFVFFGLNATSLLDEKFPEAQVEPHVQALAQRGVNALRVWFFHYHDPDRFARLLDIGARHGVRFVVTLEDNVFKGVDYFFSNADEERYRPHVDRTVARFKDRPEILLWEPINEPNCGDGRHDDDCLKVIRDWTRMMADRIKQADSCHMVSTGMIGDGNYENEERSYRMLHRSETIDLLSVHKRSVDRRETELELARDEDKPIFYGEIYDEVFDDGCIPLGGDRAPEARAERIKADLRQAIDDGVDGYLLWDYSAGTIGKDVFCSKFGYGLDDPLWGKLQRSEDVLPPPVPWK